MAIFKGAISCIFLLIATPVFGKLVQINSTSPTFDEKIESSLNTSFTRNNSVENVEECDCGPGVKGKCEFHENGEKNPCVCKDGFQLKNGKCEECDCGPGVEGKCEFDENGEKKPCLCKHGFQHKNGKCEECDCGPGVKGKCEFNGNGEKKHCVCKNGFQLKNGKCEECDCGPGVKGKCEFRGNGEKKHCECKNGFQLKNGKCEERNFCKSNPCLNGGICVNKTENNTYKCNCSGTYTGKNCEIGCGGHLYIGSGTIQSPNFPDEYSNDMDCSWFLYAPVGYKIELKFFNFSLESSSACGLDYLEIRDGVNLSSHVIGKFCGDTIPNTLASTENSMTLIFHTDYSVVRTGFKLFYNALFITENDVCRPNPCLNDGICKQMSNTYKCICPKAHTGKICDIDSCDCGVNSYGCEGYGFLKKCYCKSGYIQNGGRCENECNCGEHSYGCAKYWNVVKCFCVGGYVQKGNTCEVECNCGENSHGCTKYWNVVLCHCKKGYTQVGENCETTSGHIHAAINILVIGNRTETDTVLEIEAFQPEEKGKSSDKRKKKEF